MDSSSFLRNKITCFVPSLGFYCNKTFKHLRNSKKKPSVLTLSVKRSLFDESLRGRKSTLKKQSTKLSLKLSRSIYEEATAGCDLTVQNELYQQTSTPKQTSDVEKFTYDRGSDYQRYDTRSFITELESGKDLDLNWKLSFSEKRLSSRESKRGFELKSEEFPLKSEADASLNGSKARPEKGKASERECRSLIYVNKTNQVAEQSKESSRTRVETSMGPKGNLNLKPHLEILPKLLIDETQKKLPSLLGKAYERKSLVYFPDYNVEELETKCQEKNSCSYDMKNISSTDRQSGYGNPVEHEPHKKKNATERNLHHHSKYIDRQARNKNKKNIFKTSSLKIWKSSCNWKRKCSIQEPNSQKQKPFYRNFAFKNDFSKSFKSEKFSFQISQFKAFHLKDNKLYHEPPRTVKEEEIPAFRTSEIEERESDRLIFHGLSTSGVDEPDRGQVPVPCLDSAASKPGLSVKRGRSLFYRLTKRRYNNSLRPIKKRFSCRRLSFRRSVVTPLSRNMNVLKKSLSSGDILDEPMSKVGSGNFFGRHLEELCDDDGSPPFLVKVILGELSQRGPSEVGIFRKSANARIVRELKTDLDSGRGILSPGEIPVSAIASLYKEFLRSLPNCLFCSKLYDLWIKVAELEDSQTKLSLIDRLLHKLSKPHLRLLSSTLRMLNKIAGNSHINMMTSLNLALCVGPSVLNPGEHTVVDYTSRVSDVIQFMIDNYFVIFVDTDEVMTSDLKQSCNTNMTCNDFHTESSRTLDVMEEGCSIGSPFGDFSVGISAVRNASEPVSTTLEVLKDDKLFNDFQISNCNQVEFQSKGSYFKSFQTDDSPAVVVLEEPSSHDISSGVFGKTSKISASQDSGISLLCPSSDEDCPSSPGSCWSEDTTFTFDDVTHYVVKPNFKRNNWMRRVSVIKQISQKRISKQGSKWLEYFV